MRGDLGPQFLEDMGGDPVGGAVGAVEDDMEIVEGVVLGKGVFQKHDIPALGIVDPRGLADLVGHRPQGRHFLREDQVFDIGLHLVRQFEAVAGEDLDAVVLKGIVRGGDHHAGIGPHGGGDKGDARRRQRADQQHIHPHGADPGGQGIFEHVAGLPGILADDDPVSPLALSLTIKAMARPICMAISMVMG